MATPYETNGQYGPIKGGAALDAKEGMIVVDASNLPVGVVTASFLHGESPARSEGHSVPAFGGADGMADGMNESGTNGGPHLIPTIAGHFLYGEKLPELIFVRLQRTGFLRVERPGLYTRTYYVTPDQIDRVSRNRIKLGVLRETLLSF